VKVSDNIPITSNNELLKKLNDLSQKISEAKVENPKSDKAEAYNILELSSNPDEMASKLEDSQNLLSVYQSIEQVIKQNTPKGEDAVRDALKNLKFNGKSALDIVGIASDTPLSEISKKVTAGIDDLKKQIGTLAVSLENINAYNSGLGMVKELLGSGGIGSLGLNNNLNPQTTNTLLQPLE
jgi:hypothetical protein